MSLLTEPHPLASVSACGPKNNRNLVLLPLLPVGSETVGAAARDRLRPIGCTTKRGEIWLYIPCKNSEASLLSQSIVAIGRGWGGGSAAADIGHFGPPSRS